MARETKSERVDLRMSKSELAMLDAVADADGISRADVVRLLVRREHAARFPAATTTSSTKRPARRR